MKNYRLTLSDDLTKQISNLGINTWLDLIGFVKNIHYGRNSDRTKPELVLTENKGTCSAKHGLLKKVADLNSVPNLKLIIGIFKMNNINTPKIGNELTKNGLEYIPEAHCYIKSNNEVIDVTSENIVFDRLKNDIIYEREIEAEQTGLFKEEFHKKYLKDWLKNQNLKINFNKLWEIRENCINKISKP